MLRPRQRQASSSAGLHSPSQLHPSQHSAPPRRQAMAAHTNVRTRRRRRRERMAARTAHQPLRCTRSTSGSRSNPSQLLLSLPPPLPPLPPLPSLQRSHPPLLRRRSVMTPPPPPNSAPARRCIRATSTDRDRRSVPRCASAIPAHDKPSRPSPLRSAETPTAFADSCLFMLALCVWTATGFPGTGATVSLLRTIVSWAELLDSGADATLRLACRPLGSCLSLAAFSHDARLWSLLAV
jgi:hypothetical protein